ncbi:MAG: septal ring lytic transglycosylase RlpA family protein [Xanthomonadales bacterium]|nr:septal ring lytic transglycosylase RlpA family protein [Xanthomonadales bacterium]
MSARSAAALLAAALLAACAARPPRHAVAPPPSPKSAAGDAAAEPADGPPLGIAIDPERIPEPVPREEPRSRYGNHSPYTVHGRRYRVLESAKGYVERGIASWYGTKFHGRPTSSFEPYDMFQYTAAHRTLPLPSYVRVTNLENGRSVVVRVNDRGPFKPDRIIDLSYVAALKLGIVERGTARVEVRALEPERADPGPADRAGLAEERGPVFVQAGAYLERENARRARAQAERRRARGRAPDARARQRPRFLARASRSLPRAGAGRARARRGAAARLSRRADRARLRRRNAVAEKRAVRRWRCCSRRAFTPAERPAPPELPVASYILIEAESETVLAAQDAARPLPPASLTKIMTAYLIFGELEAGRLRLDEPVTVSENAWRRPGSRMFLEAGSRVTVEELLKGMIIQSGNDATIALAEHVAGTEAAFVARMNQEAERLGLRETRFATADGLPGEGHQASARDLARLARALIRRHPQHYRWYAEREFTWNGIRQHNRNLLLARDPTVDGMKTGHTREAGYCLVASAKRGGLRLISVVMGAESERARADQSQLLLEWGFRNFEAAELYAAGAELARAPLWKGREDSVAVGVAERVYLVLPRGAFARLKAELELRQPLLAPLAAGSEVGRLRIALDGEPVLERPAVVIAEAPSGGFFRRLHHGFQLWWSGGG